MCYLRQPPVVERMLLAFAFVGAAAATADAQEKLNWKLKASEKLNYTIVNEMNLSMLAMGRNTDTKIILTLDITWDVRNVANDGTATLAQTMNRVRFVMTGGVFEKIEYDSAKPKVGAENPIQIAMSKAYAALIDNEITMKISPLGKTSDIKLPKKFLDIVEGAQPAGRTPGMIDKHTLEAMITKSAVGFPAAGVAIGKAWKNEIVLNRDFGMNKVETTYTFKGTQQKDGTTLARIEVSPKMAITPKQGAPYTIKLKNQSGDGTILFDIKKGRVKSSSMKQKVVMEVTIGGQTIEYTTDTTFSVKLAPTK